MTKPVRFQLTQVQQAREERDLRLHASSEASKEEVQVAASSCVNHLCGCKSK